MFQRKTEKHFKKQLPNVFGIADGILVIGNEKDGNFMKHHCSRYSKIYIKENLTKINIISDAWTSISL